MPDSNSNPEIAAVFTNPQEHLGRKIYEPKDETLIEKINEVGSLFEKALGPNSAKFVKFLITEEKPAYPEYSQEELDASMGAHSRVFQEVGKHEPFNLIGYVDTRIKSLDQKIKEAKINGAAKGLSEPQNTELHELGKASVLAGKTLLEISKKFPTKFSELRERQAKSHKEFLAVRQAPSL